MKYYLIDENIDKLVICRAASMGANSKKSKIIANIYLDKSENFAYRMKCYYEIEKLVKNLNEIE